jgi:hypothetical protein
MPTDGPLRVALVEIVGAEFMIRVRQRLII